MASNCCATGAGLLVVLLLMASRCALTFLTVATALRKKDFRACLPAASLVIHCPKGLTFREGCQSHAALPKSIWGKHLWRRTAEP